MRIDFAPDPALYPFTSRWFDSSRGRVHYVDEGSGPVIMFFHGNPTWSFLYRDIITGLRDQFRCIAADYLGFGMSERPSGFSYRIEEHAHVMGELVDRLDLDGYLTVGQDWGGPISMAVDIARADRVRGVVLGNPGSGRQRICRQRRSAWSWAARRCSRRSCTCHQHHRRPRAVFSTLHPSRATGLRSRSANRRLIR
jgi:pimeloyl-ACP methyl ester carboxylesterase